MFLMQMLIGLIVVGVILWLVNTYIPMDSKIRTIINIVVVVLVIVYLLGVFGIIRPVFGFGIRT